MPKAPNSPTLAHVHETAESVATIELTPPHAPRVETETYKKAHHFLVYEKKAGCHICGITVDDLDNSATNPHGVKTIETHHYPVERSLVDACDPVKVHADFPAVFDGPSLLAWVDTPANLLVLCDYHHRGTEHGIHHLLTQDWVIQKYLLDGYQVAATKADATSAEATDEQIEQTQNESVNTTEQAAA